MSPNVAGTYNNQYMVLDLKKVAIKKSLDKGTLYIVEQIPTYVEYSEQTDVLKKGTVFPACRDCAPICPGFISALVLLGEKQVRRGKV